MEGDFSRVYSLRSCCAASPLEPSCHVPLPHGSPLGKYEPLRFRPTSDGWPATFVCLRHGLATVRSSEDIETDLEVRVPGVSPSPVWQIKCKCVHEGCGKRHTLYASGANNWGEVWRRILKFSPKVPCGDHDLEWRKDLMRGTMFAHDLPCAAERDREASWAEWAVQRQLES